MAKYRITGTNIRELEEGFLVTLDREIIEKKGGEDSWLPSLEFAKDTKEEALKFAQSMLLTEHNEKSS